MVKVKEVGPAFPSATVTSLIENDGGVTVIAAHCCSLSTMAQAEPLVELLEVKVDCDCPEVKPLLPGNMLPLVAVNEAFGNGSVVSPAGVPAFESCVMSAVTVEVPPGEIEAGEALASSTIHGSKSAPVPVTVPQPVCFGPALQPHQLFSRLGV